LPNGGAGIELDALATNEIGCTIPGEGNIIAGNGGDGVEITAEPQLI